MRIRHGVYMNKYNVYDFDKAEEIRDDYYKKSIDLYKKLFEARENGDEKAIKKAMRALVKHRAKEKGLKELAEKSKVFWY